MTITKYSIKLIMILLSLMITFSVSNAQVINDPLNGSTTGTQVGGTFTSEGYKPGTGSNHILYTVPSQVSNGYVEFQMKGFTHSGISGEGNDHAFLAMFDGRGVGSNPTWANYRDNYFRWNFHWRQNASVFKCVVNCAAPTSARLNSTYAVFVEDRDGDGDVDIEDRDWYDEPSGTGWSWDESKSTWYTVKIEWNNKTYKAYVNGSKVWENHKTGLYDYAPVDHKIWLGSGIDKYDSDNPDVVYRNFKLVNLGGSSSYLTVSPSSENVSSSSGNTSFSVSSNVSWSVSDDASWLSVSPTSGSGNGTLTASYDANSSSSSRTATITVSGGGITRNVTVVQAGQTPSDYLTVSPSSQSVSFSSGNTSFSVSSNVSWSVSDDASWLSVSPTSGSGNATLTASYDANSSSSSRTGTITITGSGITRTVTVIQDGQSSSNYLTVSPSSRSVSSDLGNTTFSVSSDVSWAVSDDAGWLQVSPTSGTGNGTLTASFDSNTSSGSRTATISVVGGGITRNVTVVQAGLSVDPFLNVTPSNHDVENTSGSVDFTIESNVIWTIRDDAEWLSKSVKDGSGNATLTVDYEANSSASQRIATITISGSGITKDVTVSQAASAAFLTVTPASKTVGDTTGSVDYSISSNVDWVITESAEWVSITPSTGSGSDNFTATFLENTSSTLRTAEIAITGGSKSETVTLVQQGREFTPYLTVSPASQNVGWEGSTFNFSIESNTDWAITDDAEWLTKSVKDGSGNATLEVTYTDNPDSSERTALLTFTAGAIIRTASLIQQGAPVFSVTAASNPETAGSISGTGTFSYNSEITLVCTPNSGWKFNSWKESGSVVSTDSIYTFNLLSNRSLVAELSEISTDIFEFGSTPTNYKLYNNFPNPFNPSTIIRYALPEGSFVELSVYNLLGQKVVELIREYKPQGFYSVEFNADNLPSGTYIYSLKAGNFSQTKKLILLK